MKSQKYIMKVKDVIKYYSCHEVRASTTYVTTVITAIQYLSKLS